jgi:hypothetical protein
MRHFILYDGVETIKFIHASKPMGQTWACVRGLRVFMRCALNQIFESPTDSRSREHTEVADGVGRGPSCGKEVLLCGKVCITNTVALVSGGICDK